MSRQLPEALAKAISTGLWRDPGPDSLRRALGSNVELPEMELFETAAVMESVATQVDRGGYVDDPVFCMVRDVADLVSSEDTRVVFGCAVFIAGSVVPGDDVFVVVEGEFEGRHEADVRVFDWRKPLPHRWVTIGSLDHFLARLQLEAR